MKHLFLILLLAFSVVAGAETIVWNGGRYTGELFKGTASLADGTIVRDQYGAPREIGIPHGHGAFTWPNGKKYVGEFKYSMIPGQGTVTLPHGTKYVVAFRDGRQHGQGSLTPPDSCDNHNMPLRNYEQIGRSC